MRVRVMIGETQRRHYRITEYLMIVKSFSRNAARRLSHTQSGLLKPSSDRGHPKECEIQDRVKRMVDRQPSHLPTIEIRIASCQPLRRQRNPNAGAASVAATRPSRYWNRTTPSQAQRPMWTTAGISQERFDGPHEQQAHRRFYEIMAPSSAA